jgi:hypothetical protein
MRNKAKMSVLISCQEVQAHVAVAKIPATTKPAS